MSTKETWFCPLPARSCSRVAHSRSSCYPAFNRRTCTYRTSYERFCICHSVARWAILCPVPITERYRMCSWAHCSRNRIWCVWTYPEWQTRWGMVLPLSSHVYSLDTDEIIRKHDGSWDQVIICFWMIASRSFYEVVNFTFIRFNPVSANLPITCAAFSPQWSWIWLVFRSTCSHIRRWTEFDWIEWCHECVWQTIPVKKANNERDTCDKALDRMIILIMLPFIDIIGVVAVTVTVNGDRSIQNGLWILIE